MKVFKNVNTIFEKLQRGVIKTSDTRLFKEMEYKVRPELVQPYMHSFDARTLRNNVSTFMRNNTDVQRNLQKLPSKVDKDKLLNDAQDFYRDDFPKEMLSDIFNSYYMDVTKLTFAEKQDANRFRYKMLENVVDPLSKIVTKESNVKSMVMTRTMVQYLSLLMAYQKQQDEEKFEEMKQEMQKQQGPKPASNGGQQAKGATSDQSGDDNDDQNSDQGDNGNDSQDQNDNGQSSDDNGKSGLNGSSKNDQDTAPNTTDFDLDKMINNLEKLMGQKGMEQLQQDMLNDAKETIKMIDNMMDESELTEDWESSTDLSMLDSTKLAQVQRDYDQLNMNVANVKHAIQKLLDRSKNYFSGKEKVSYESILDSDSLEGLDDFVLLHPKLRHVMLDNINVKETNREGRINIYIDISVSMNDSCTMAGSNLKMAKIDFAKAFVLKMKQMHILNKVYLFNGSVTSSKGRLFDIAAIRSDGGTDINRVVHHINTHKENAIVLTDAEDNCRYYSDNAYFIGVEGCQFNYFDTNVMHQYAAQNQCIMFDGKSIHDINEHGNVVSK